LNPFGQIQALGEVLTFFQRWILYHVFREKSNKNHFILEKELPFSYNFIIIMKGWFLMNKARIDLAELRKAAYGYQRDIARKMDISPQAVSERLNGHRKMTLDDLNTICEVVKRPASDFILFENDTVEIKKAA
jgi:hypothetical protein